MVYLLLAFQVVGFIILAYLMVYLFLTLRRTRAANGAEAVKSADPSPMIAELRRAVDQIGQDLSARSAVLEHQIEAMDRRGDRLESLISRAAERPSAPRSEPRPTPQPVAQPAPHPVAPPPPEYVRPEPEPASQPAPRPPTVDSTSAPLVRSEPTPSPVGFRPSELRDAERYQQVFALADQGLSSLEIARRTRVGREEVELLLGLRESGGSAPQS